MKKLPCPSTKNRYESEEDAKRAARNNMLFHASPPLQVYLCWQCHGHHLTSRVQRPKKR